MISKKKHERFLYILLSIYTFLVMVFMLLLNGFFVNPKGFTDGTNYTISYNLVAYDDETCTTDVKYTWSGNSRYIFYSDPDFKEILDNVVSDNLNKDVSCSCIRISKTNQDHIIGGSVSSSVESQIGPYSAAAQQNFAISFENSTIYNYFKDKGYALDPVAGYPYFVNFVVNGANINGNKIIGGELLGDDIQYIDSAEDLYDYMVNNNDDVVKVGNPDNPPLPEDDSLPVPQKLGTDIQNDNVGTPPFISGSWENPGSIYASFDASQVKVEIQYKPVFQLYKKVFNLKLAKVSSSDWLPVITTQISNNTFNRYVLYNAKTGYPKPFDSQTIFSGSLTDDIESVGNSSGYINMFNPISARIANGTNWRIRYIVGNKTSLWVVFHVNSIGSLKNNESVSFENASGDSVSAEDVNYTNSAQTETIDKLNVNNFFDSLNAAINGIFNTANNSMTAQDTEGSKGFYAMFKATFEKFPVFWTFFCLGLIVAILLRILGR